MQNVGGDLETGRTRLKARWLELNQVKRSGLVALVSGASVSVPLKYAALYYVWGSS